MNTAIISKVRSFVEKEFQKPTSHYGWEPIPWHVVPTVKYAAQLAKEMGADQEVVIIAAWLHDIGSAASGRKDHHITGAKIAEKKLEELGYPPEKIALVKRCILNHRGSQHKTRRTLEEQIVAEADTMSNFDNIGGIFKAAFVYEKQSQGEARKSVLKKLKNKWEDLHFEKSKKIVRPKFEAAKLLLG